MPFWIKGWIETSTGPLSDSPIWFATVNLAPLIDTGDEVSEKLFGLSKEIARDRARMKDALFAQPGANHMQWELTLEFRLPTGSHRMEQSWPTRDSGAS